MEGVSQPSIRSVKEDSILVNTECEGKGTDSNENPQEGIIYIRESLHIKDEPEEIFGCIKKEVKDEVEVGVEELEEFEPEERHYFSGCMKGDLTETSQHSLTHAALPEVFPKVKVETQDHAEFNDLTLDAALCAAETGNLKPEEEWHKITSNHQSSELRSERIFGKEFGCGKDPVVRLSPEKTISVHQNLGNFEGPEENLRRKFGCEREAVVKLARLSLAMMDPLQAINSKGKLEHAMKDTGMLDTKSKSLYEGLSVTEGPGNHLSNKGGSAELKETFPVKGISFHSSFKTVDQNYWIQVSPFNDTETQLACNDSSYATSGKGDTNASCITPNKEKKFACAQCSFRTSSKRYLREHRSVHGKEKKFACEQCSYETKDRKSFRVHCLNHTNIKKFACDQCSFKTNDKKSMINHCLIHSNFKKFSCDQCPYKTNLKGNLTQHCLTHSNFKKFACDQCSYKTNFKSHITQHCLSHSDIKRFACDQCSYKTNRKDHLAVHCHTHVAFKRFACDQCSYKTNYKHDFTQHCLNHRDFKRFACDQCSYKTNRKSHLTRHCLTHVSFKKI